MTAKFLPIESKLRKLGFFIIAGIDEAGRGPLAGPVVSAAVILERGTRLKGLNDSKKLSKRKREKLYDEIIEKAASYSISIIPPSVIDEINILNAVRLANKLCVEHLTKKPDFIVIDGKDKQIIKEEFQTIIKGDQRVRCIAAASILAKVFRDRLMEHYSKKYKEYGFERHMGYGTREHRRLIKKHGRSEIHRKSFSVK
ncbi:ribonuclease HII [Candidatus Peregrinibacteria bacterium]|jgi:ribonuclease HII|nr:ribonuclease HII [Candidatus Peregrinibacteria bacterium]MBT7736297.1 ribonuclease HII [Candidatus Peregrinibacteria bacterium]